MGSAHSTDARHARIWNNLSQLESTAARMQMLDTLFSGQEYVQAAKRAGIYASLLQWVAAQRRGEFYAWPQVALSTAPAAPAAPTPAPMSRSVMAPMSRTAPSTAPSREPVLRITEAAVATAATATATAASSSALAKIPPPKRAMDILNESYRILEIDDSKPLSHETLRIAYKRAAIRAHPDKGGNADAFDAVTRAFLYLQEILEKLIPKTAADGSDPRFSAPVTMDSALRARGITSTAPAPPGTLRVEDAPPIALNPKKLDMSVFNKLFEENRLPDPEKDDGYGDWLKSQDTHAAPSKAMRGKYNADIFNKTFVEEARTKTSTGGAELSRYKPPSELTLAPGFGAELGSGRPENYTKAPVSNGIGYTDLKYAYGTGSTFSQDVADVSLDGRPKNLEEAKREYGAAPRALTAIESAAIASLDRAKEFAETQRRQRLAAHDVNAESVHNQLQKRLMIQQ